MTTSFPLHTWAPPPGSGSVGLTERQTEVAERITNGYSNDEIAAELEISLDSVKTHIRYLYRKIGAETRPQAIIWGVRQGLLLDPPD